MPIEVTPYTIPLLIVVAVGTGLFLLMAWFREEKGAYPLMGVFGGAVIWAGAYAMEFSSASMHWTIFWHNVRFFGSTLVPVSILLLALQFTGRERLVTWRNAALLYVVPGLTNVVIWTNGIHKLWGVYRYDPDKTLLLQLSNAWGPWFPIYTFYSFGVAFSAIALFAGQALDQDVDSIVNKTTALLAATLLPTLGTFVYVVGYSPMDFGPFAFVASGVLIMGAMFYLEE